MNHPLLMNIHFNTIFDYIFSIINLSISNLQLHECGYRGVSSVESGALGGAAHLVNFVVSFFFEFLKQNFGNFYKK